MLVDYKLLKAAQVETFQRPYWYIFPTEANKATALSDIKVLRSHALRLFHSLSPLKVSTLDKAMYSVGPSMGLPIRRARFAFRRRGASVATSPVVSDVQRTRPRV
jgi:hypothetical protein